MLCVKTLHMKSFALFQIALGLSLSSVSFASNVIPGDRAIAPDNRAVTVLKIEESTAVVDPDGKDNDDTLKSYKLAELSPAVECLDGVCPGMEVIDRNKRVGRVLEIFGNGKAKVYILESAKVEDRLRKDLSLSFLCTSDVCVGDSAVDHHNNDGTVLKIFDNGSVLFHYKRKYDDQYLTLLKNLKLDPAANASREADLFNNRQQNSPLYLEPAHQFYNHAGPLLY